MQTFKDFLPAVNDSPSRWFQMASRGLMTTADRARALILLGAEEHKTAGKSQLQRSLSSWTQKWLYSWPGSWRDGSQRRGDQYRLEVPSAIPRERSAHFESPLQRGAQSNPSIPPYQGAYSRGGDPAAGGGGPQERSPKTDMSASMVLIFYGFIIFICRLERNSVHIFRGDIASLELV